MDNLGDWLYIILLVVAGASSLFSSGKKKRRQQEEERRRREVIFPEVLDFPAFLEPEPLEERKAVIPPRPVPKALRQPIVVPERNAARFEEADALSPVTAEEFHNPEALRKAVIYAEIFNRKY
ncbi:MAG: hypothetical protein LBB27_00800 [Tannerellaceae bacterium]|jgi:hypothetical protein|nr:hypothetical protein [Tannerellaceae bacterium]